MSDNLRRVKNVKRVPEAIFLEAYATNDFEEVIAILCRAFKIPDLTTRSGLKKVFEDFDNIYRRLDKAYAHYREFEDDRTQCGILTIFAKMSADSILRDLIYQRGIIKKVLPLLRNDTYRNIALHGLLVFTEPGGAAIRIDIARLTPIFMQLITKYPDDDDLRYTCLLILMRTLPIALADGAEPDPVVVRTVNIPGLLDIFIKSIQRPEPEYRVVDYAIHITGAIAITFPGHIRRNIQLIKLLVAGLRSKRWDFRSRCFAALFCMHGAPGRYAEIDVDGVRQAVQRGFSEPVKSIIQGYGEERCEFHRFSRTLERICMPFVTYCHILNRDAYRLGLDFADFIINFEFASDEWPVWVEDIFDHTLPFVTFSDALRFSAQAIRKNLRTDKDKHIPDVLETKFLLNKDRLPEAIGLAESALSHSPNIAWFYYVIASATGDSDGEKCLLAAKRGLQCTATTPTLRRELLCLAVDHGAQLGMNVLRMYPIQKSWDDGIALYRGALEDAKTFIHEAPPDHRHMSVILDWFSILTIIVSGPDMSEDLNDDDMRDAQKRLEVADKLFAVWAGRDIRTTQMRLVKETIMTNYRQAATEWKTEITKIDNTTDALPTSAGNPKHSLTGWLEGTEVMGGKVSDAFADLCRCARCGNASAVLRKCAGCTTARYCGTECQKAHWETHKKVCKGKSQDAIVLGDAAYRRRYNMCFM